MPTQLPYSMEQRQKIIELKYQNQHESYENLRKRYNAEPISMSHPMVHAQNFKKTFYRWIQTGSVLDRKAGGRPVAVTNDENVAFIMAAVQENPITSIL